MTTLSPDRAEAINTVHAGWPASQPSVILRSMSLVGPPRTSANPLEVMRKDLRLERAASAAFPPGPTHFSLARTNAIVEDPVPLLVEAYERYGPVFTMRIFHHNVVFM